MSWRAGLPLFSRPSLNRRKWSVIQSHESIANLISSRSASNPCSAAITSTRSASSEAKARTSLANQQTAGGGDEGAGGWGGWGSMAVAVGGGVTLAVLLEDHGVRADSSQEILDAENRIRHFGTTERIFDYFSSFQTTNSKGKKVTLMSVKDFCKAVTPVSTLDHGTGRGIYTVLSKEDISSKELYDLERIPCKESVLNQIQAEGFITYMDFIFLIHIVATPRRYMDIVFHAFDVSADGDIEAKEFVHVISKMISHKGNPSEFLEENYSGLINFLFGRDRTKSIKRSDFDDLQGALRNEMLYIEFCRYDSENTGFITEVDFCKHILHSANIPNKKKEKMMSRVEKSFPNSKGISFSVFCDFYTLLFGGSDLERAMFFLETDSERDGVSKEELIGIAKWVAGKEMDRHVIDVVYALLDQDGDMNLTVREFVPVMFKWRESRGFQKASVQLSLGSLKI